MNIYDTPFITNSINSINKLITTQNYPPEEKFIVFALNEEILYLNDHLKKHPNDKKAVAKLVEHIMKAISILIKYVKH